MRRKGSYNQRAAAAESRPAAAALSDPEAFLDLYRTYMPRVYAYVAYRVGSIQDAEDIVSETFLRALANFGRFRHRTGGSFGAWVFRIAHNLIRDRERRRKRMPPPLPLDAAFHVADDGPSASAALEQLEDFAELRRLIATLAPQRQRVVLLRFFGGLRNSDIAKVLGLDERTVASHLSRGIQDLHRNFMASREEP